MKRVRKKKKRGGVAGEEHRTCAILQPEGERQEVWRLALRSPGAVCKPDYTQGGGLETGQACVTNASFHNITACLMTPLPSCNYPRTFHSLNHWGLCSVRPAQWGLDENWLSSW